MNTKPRPQALLISIFFPPEFGGGSSGAYNRAMTLYKMGYDVCVLCGFPSYPSGRISDPKYRGKVFYQETAGPFKIFRLRPVPLSHTGFLKRLVIFLGFILLTVIYFPKITKIAGDIKLVYARAPILFSCISGYIYSKITGAFFVYEAPDIWPEELVATRSWLVPIIFRIGKIMARFSYTVPDLVITIGEFAASHIRKTYRTRVPVYGVPVGIDPSSFSVLPKHSAREELVQKKIISQEMRDKFIILYSGLISEAQRVETLVYAAKKLREIKDIAILIIGEGPQKEKLLDIKDKFQLDNVYFVSYQPRNIMPSIISAADICAVMLSDEPIFNIALPTKFYEYLACSKPLLGVCHGELAKIINTYKIGIVASDIESIYSSILYLKDSPLIVQTFEKNCTRALERFSLDNVASTLKEIILVK